MARRDESNRADRLPRRQSDVRAQGLRGGWRGDLHAGRRRRSSATARRSSCLASVTSARPASLTIAWRAAIRAAVAHGVPLLGICLGLQWLFEGSDEAPGFRARRAARPVLQAAAAGEGAARRVELARRSFGRRRSSTACRWHAGVLHAFVTPRRSRDDTVASATHGATFAAAVQRERVCGVQFHPEKSGDAGLQDPAELRGDRSTAD